jgi:ubiquinol-cytochrome c reductase cytochrome b subunit
VGICAYLIVFGYFVFFNPYILGDPENFNKANAMITPKHIVPEWYFLFAYAILRYFPTKLSGLLALVSSILVLFVIPFLADRVIKSNAFKPISKFFFWIFVFNFMSLTYLGSKPAEEPWLAKTGFCTLLYFTY